jgi:hypothetical protein
MTAMRIDYATREVQIPFDYADLRIIARQLRIDVERELRRIERRTVEVDANRVHAPRAFSSAWNTYCEMES